MCVMLYHHKLCACQRNHPDIDIACDADDTYLHGPCAPQPDGSTPPLFHAYDNKRILAARPDCNLTSALPKTNLFSLRGDLSAAPPDIPGSPNHPTDATRRHTIKMVGGYIGHDDAVSSAIDNAIKHRLSPLTNITNMTRLAQDTARNILQLQLNLLSTVACAIPSYWMANQLPTHTAQAATTADTAIRETCRKLIRADDSPPTRASLALNTATQLPAHDGGIGLRAHEHDRHAQFLATQSAIHASVTKAYPMTPRDDTPTTTAHARRAAYDHIQRTLHDVRQKHAALDQHIIYWVDGTKHTPFRVPLPPLLRLPTYDDVFVNTSDEKQLRFTQRKLLAIYKASTWLSIKAETTAYDDDHPHGTISHREGRRLISCSQEGSGAHVTRHPDPNVIGTIVNDDDLLIRIQRRAGLHLSCLKPIYDRLEAMGRAITEHERLGDAAINLDNTTKRHNDSLRAVFTALASVSDPTMPGAIKLGDRGDGTPAGRAEAKQRWAWANSDHIPDIIKCSVRPHLWEWKCYTPFSLSHLIGTRSAPSTTDGHITAMGCTEENLRRTVLGLTGQGTAADHHHSRSTGAGHIPPHDGQYADAIAKRHFVTLLATENTGAFNKALTHLLRHLAHLAKSPAGNDSTIYGTSRLSPQSFYQHHAAAISAAIVAADSATILKYAASCNEHHSTTVGHI
jgi:hypothetical protein